MSINSLGIYPCGLETLSSSFQTFNSVPLQSPCCQDYPDEIHIHNFPIEVVNLIFSQLEPCFALNMLCTDKTFSQNVVLKDQQLKMKIFRDYVILKRDYDIFQKIKNTALIPPRNIEKLLPFYKLDFVSKIDNNIPDNQFENSIKVLASYNFTAATRFFMDNPEIPEALINAIKRYDIDYAFEYLKSKNETPSKHHLLIQLAQSYTHFGDNESLHKAKEILMSFVSMAESLKSKNSISVEDKTPDILISAAHALLNIDNENAKLITDCLIVANLKMRDRPKPVLFKLDMQIAHLKAYFNEQEGCALMEERIKWLSSLPSIVMRPNEKDLSLKSIAPMLEPFKVSMKLAIDCIQCPITKIEMLNQVSLPICANDLEEALKYVNNNLPSSRIKNLSFLAYLYQKVDATQSKKLIEDVFMMLNDLANKKSALFYKSLGEAIKAFPPYDKSQLDKIRSSISELNVDPQSENAHVDCETFNKIIRQIKLADCYKLINPELAHGIIEYAFPFLIQFKPQLNDEKIEYQSAIDRISNLIVQIQPKHTYLFFDDLKENIKVLEGKITTLNLDSIEEAANKDLIFNIKMIKQKQIMLLSNAIEGIIFNARN